MTAAREAFGLPLTLLTVVLIGGIRLTAPIVIAAPTAFSLVLATILMAVFVQSGALDPARLLHSGRPALANFNGLLALVALFLYSLLPIVRGAHTGLTGIARSVRESAEVLGLTPAARFWRIELPLAAGPVIAGVRTAAVISVGTATIAAFIGAGGYGERIVTGLALNDDALLLAGALPAALLALVVEAVFALAGRLLVPRGLRL